MLDVALLFLTVFLGCCWWLDVFKLALREPKDPRCLLPLPPGPEGGTPFLGHLPLLARDPRPQFALWRQEYGDVFSFYMARRLVVVLNGYDTIREALVKRADVFSVRPSMFVTEFVTRSGIAFNSGSSWKEQRKLSIEILRSLGMGKARFTTNIMREVQHFLGAVHDLQGQPRDLAQMVGVSMSNNICSVVFGRRFSYDNASFLRYLQLMSENLQLLRSTNLLNYIPWLSYLPGDLFGAKKILRNVAEMERCFLIPQIQAHIDAANRHERERAHRDDKINYDEHNNDRGTIIEDRHDNFNHHYDNDAADDVAAADDDDEHADFISAYLAHIKREKACGKLTGSLNENLENLEWTVSDLFVAGTETLAKSLLWTLLYLLHHPRVQTACFRQIRDTIGLSTQPSGHHRKDLPYIEATIMETLRVGDIGALGLQHGVTEDVEFRGCLIPSSAIVVPYLHTALNDPKTWGDPHCFRPERFLDPDTGALVKREELIPFSVGRRACPGEGIARLQLFLYVTSLIQHFRFMPEEEGQLPSLEGIMEFTHSPEPFRIRAVPRNGSEDE